VNQYIVVTEDGYTVPNPTTGAELMSEDEALDTADSLEFPARVELADAATLAELLS